MMSQFHAPPHVIETEIELFLDNFKYVTSLLNSEFSVFDCSQLNNAASTTILPQHVYRESGDNNRLSWPESHDSWTTSISGPKHSVTSPSDNNRNSMTSSSMLSTDVTSFEFELDPVPSTNVGQISDTDGVTEDNTAAELGSCNLTVIDVVDALQANYAYISGGKSRCYCHIITFPECPVAQKITDEQYRNLVTYLTSIPPLHDADIGFVVIVDRRRNRWGSVKTLLLRISNYFPALVQKIYVLRPASFLQKAFADVALKFLADDFKAKILMLNSAEDLLECIDKDQLTPNLGGTLIYNHHEWIQQRAALEKFSGLASDIAGKLRQLCGRLQDTQFPNDVKQTEELMAEHNTSLSKVRQELDTVIQHGETLLVCFKTIRTSYSADGHLENLTHQDTIVSTCQLPLCRAGHVTTIERLLVQLDETSSNFETFWTNHKHRLEQCLQLRYFEEQFKQIHCTIEQHMTSLHFMIDKRGDSLEETIILVNELRQFETSSKADIARAEELRVCGEQFINSSHYAIDCIRPKCVELKRICSEYDDVTKMRFTDLEKQRQFLEESAKGKTDSYSPRSSEERISTYFDNGSLCDKQLLVTKELIETERIYCFEIGSIVKGYLWQLDNAELQHLLTDSLRLERHILFGNLDEIYSFHSNIFLQDLQDSNNEVSHIANCFVQRSSQFQMYGIYCQNMKASEQLLRQLTDSNTFLQECRKKLQQRLPLGAYLLKPVQRITKYQLLLKELLKHCQDDTEYTNVQRALAAMTSVVKYVNDAMHQNSIKGYHGNFIELGQLLMQGPFNVCIEHRWDKIRDLRFKPMSRHVFLYKNAVLLCKEKQDQQNTTASVYIFKNIIKTEDVGLTEAIKGDPRKFELWSPGRTDVYILQATSVESKEIWINEIKRLLQSQFNELRDHRQVDHHHTTRSRDYDARIGSMSSLQTSDTIECLSQTTDSGYSISSMQQSMKRSETEPVQSSIRHPESHVMKRSETQPVSTAILDQCELSNSSTLDASM